VPTLFDCLEFDESLATIEILYDFAFLLMDLWHRDRRELADRSGTHWSRDPGGARAHVLTPIQRLSKLPGSF
jgi:aminoglycoside phosphotransferase family enzyme